MRTRAARVAAAFILAIGTLGGGFALPAAAATQNTTLTFSGSATVQSSPQYAAICDLCAPDASFGGDNVGLGIRFHIAAVAAWNPTASVTYAYSSSLLRRGQTLDLNDSLTGGSGPLSVTYSLTGDYGIYWNGLFPSDASLYKTDTNPISISTQGTGTCTLKLNGDGSYDCQTTDNITIVNANLWGLVGVNISVPVTTTISISPAGVTTVRTITVGGSTFLGPDPLTFNGPTPALVSDPVAVPCAAPVGDDMMYDLASTQTDPSLVATTTVSLTLQVTIIITVGSTVQLATIGPGSPVVMTLKAPSNQTDLGPILANNIPPIVNAGGPYDSATEGVPQQFDGSGTASICPVGLNYLWNFSDGGIAYGVQPYHTFQGPGTYSGQLTVTDADGNSAAQQFSITVANQAPVVSAGPNLGAAWGQPVAFNGSAVDPGANDQSTLTYSWTFGDGTPSATGGASVTHAYATPGSYTAIFQACDQWGACASSTTAATIRARNVTLGYLGTYNGAFDTSATFRGSLVDEFGQAVSGGSMGFTAGTETEGTATTNSSGIASIANVTELVANSYTATATYGGDGLLYNPAPLSSGTLTIVQKATTTTYTGALTGGANKTIVMSATLFDATGKPLGGKTIAFKLGTQTASAVTLSSGVASVSLKLSQKNGTYPLTATYTPALLDVSKYLGSAASATFKLQAK